MNHLGNMDVCLVMSCYNEWFKDTLVQRTASGGYHYFFMKPKAINITQAINFMDGIDIRAHVNNYVLMAPSQINGNQKKGGILWGT